VTTRTAVCERAIVLLNGWRNAQEIHCNTNMQIATNVVLKWTNVMWMLHSQETKTKWKLVFVFETIKVSLF
jgi:hypothetical protein